MRKHTTQFLAAILLGGAGLLLPATAATAAAPSPTVPMPSPSPSAALPGQTSTFAQLPQTGQAAAASKVAPLDGVACDYFTSSPTYSGGRISGTGAYLSCTPHDPWSCAVQTDVQVYFSVGGLGWQTYASGPKSTGCPPYPVRSTASTTCSATTQLWKYRTSTVYTEYYGTVMSIAATSAVASFYCQ
jgi:hypothetical protein